MARVITNEFLQYVPKHIIEEHKAKYNKPGTSDSLTSCLREVIAQSVSGRDAIERIAMWYESVEGRRYKELYGKSVVITRAENLWNEYHANPFSSI